MAYFSVDEDLSERFFDALCEYLFSTTSGRLNDDNISALQKYGFPPAIARGFLSKLQDDDLIESTEKRLKEVSGGIMPSFTPTYERLTVNWQLTAKGASRAYTRPKSSLYVLPKWDSTPLEIELSLVADAVAATEALKQAVQENNELAEKEPKTRALVLRSLTDGLNLLKSNLSNAAQLTTFILQPAKWLLERAGNAAIGELAKRAIEAVLKLF